MIRNHRTFAAARTFGAALIAAALLAACNGGSSALPGSGSAGSSAQRIVAAQPTVPPCRVAPLKVPGTYVVLTWFGNVNKNKFSGPPDRITGWVLEKYKSVASAPPTPRPTAAPGTPLYYYYGTYRMAKSGQVGCVKLVTTVDETPVFKWVYSKFNSELSGSSNLDAKFITGTVESSGPMTGSPISLSAKGGRGIYKLYSDSNVFYDSAIISFNGRVLVK
jgi:hypothetical protein